MSDDKPNPYYYDVVELGESFVETIDIEPTFTLHFGKPGEPEKTVTLSGDSVEIVGMELDEAAQGFWKALPEWNPLNKRVERLENRELKMAWAFNGLYQLIRVMDCWSPEDGVDCLGRSDEGDPTKMCNRCQALRIVEVQVRHMKEGE